MLLIHFTDGAIYSIKGQSLLLQLRTHLDMADSGGYTMDWMGTGTRANVFRGATSNKCNYTTTFLIHRDEVVFTKSDMDHRWCFTKGLVLLRRPIESKREQIG